MPSTLGLIASHRVAPPPPIPTVGLLGWYDAADASTFTYSSGTVVAQWNDKSGSGFHATQSLVGTQPSRVDAVINGRAAVLFAAGKAGMNSTLPADSKPFTVVAVIRTGATVTGQTFLGKSLGTDAASMAVDMNASKLRLMVQATTVIGSCTTNLAVSTAVMVGVTYDAAGVWTHYRNGTADGTGTNSRTFAAGVKHAIGGAASNGTSSVFLGHIGELVKYDRVLDATDRGTVESYLRAKWGTP